MKLKKNFLVLTALFIFLGTNLALAVTDNASGDSGDSGDITPSISGDENTSSGETSNVLLSTAEDSKFIIEKGDVLTSSMEATASGDETFDFIVITLPSHGTLTRSNEKTSSFTYTPSGDYVGNDSFTFRLESGEKYSNVATVSITIEDNTPIIPFNYKDMQNHWANFSASHLAARGFIIGEEINNNFYFNPDDEMTRADFMLFLLSVINTDTAKKSENISFSDESDIPEWFLDDAKLAYSMKIINGIGNGENIAIYPNRKITRAEAFVMINNALATKTTLTDSVNDLTYKDKNNIPNWATQAIKNLTGYKIVQGGNGNNIKPNDIVTRGQAAELCYKLLKQIESSALTPSGDVK